MMRLGGQLRPSGSWEDEWAGEVLSKSGARCTWKHGRRAWHEGQRADDAHAGTTDEQHRRDMMSRGHAEPWTMDGARHVVE